MTSARQASSGGETQVAPVASLAVSGQAKKVNKPVPADCTPAEALVARNAELMEENARLLEAIASRDAFLAIAAHELRNPMTAIVGRVSYLRRLAARRDVSPEKIDNSFELLEWLISRYVQRATTLLDVSRVNTGNFNLNPDLFDVCTLIREVGDSVRPLAEHAGSVLVFELPDNGVTLHTDRLALEQILDNLLSNAIKYGGATPILIRATADDVSNTLAISVRDNGPGIAVADQARIFDRFERAVRPGERAAGFGVGLWIVRQLTQALGGTINVQSEPGAGSTFTIMMPLQQAKDTE